MKKALILTADRFEDMEVLYPMFRLQEAGWKVTIAAPELETIRGEYGYSEISPEVKIDEANPDDYDLLVVPGGLPDGAPTTIRKIENAREIVKSFFAKNKPVVSVCHGPWLLADAGVLKGKNVTSYWHDGVPEDIKKAGGIWKDEDVVVDKNLITSRWPADLPVFMREVMKLIDK